MTFFGIDPGIGRVGWGVIEQTGNKFKSLAYGCLETSSKLPHEKRLVIIHNFLKQKLRKLKPDIVAVEDLFFAKNTKTALSVGQARGVIVLTAALANLPIYSYTPLQIKQAITGYGRAEKKQIQAMVQKLLNLDIVPCQDDAADALAIALTGAFSYKLEGKL